MRAIASLAILFFAAAAAPGAAVPSIEALADGSVRVLAGGEELISSMGLVFPEKTRAAPSKPGRSPVVTAGGSEYVLSSASEEASGGRLIDFVAAPPGTRHETAWAEFAPVRVRMELRLGPAMTNGAIVLDGDTLVSLGPGEASAQSVFGGGDVKAARQIEFIPKFEGARLHIEFEMPCEIGLTRRGDGIVLLLGETVFEPRRSVRFAAWFGASRFAGGPVFVGSPEAAFDSRLGCFEITVRAIGVESESSIGSSAGGAGFLAHRFEAVGKDIQPRGWPRFALRLPAEAGGRTVDILLRSGGKKILRAVVLPGVNARRFEPRTGPLSGPSFAFSDESVRFVQRLAEAEVVAARMELDLPGQDIDPALAWKLDRLFEAASEAGVSIKLAAAVPGRETAADFVRQVCSRWSAVRAWAGLELPFSAFDGPSDLSRAAGLASELDAANALAVRLEPHQIGLLKGLRAIPAIALDPSSPRPAEFETAQGYAVMDVPPGTDQGALWRAALAGWQGVFFRRSEAFGLSRFLTARPATGLLEETLQFEDLEYAAFVAKGARGALWYLSATATTAEEVGFAVEGISPGLYRVEWWDPALGRIQTSYTVRSLGGSVPVRLPGFFGAAAGRLVPVNPSRR